MAVRRRWGFYEIGLSPRASGLEYATWLGLRCPPFWWVRSFGVLRVRVLDSSLTPPFADSLLASAALFDAWPGERARFPCGLIHPGSRTGRPVSLSSGDTDETRFSQGQA